MKLSREAVVEARERIGHDVIETPLRESSIGGARLWLKCECLQTGGAFKLRGATNRLKALSAEERTRGVVAFSSGNHAQGVAIAAKRLGIPATIVMPSDAPRLKIAGTEANGAKIVFYERNSESREAIAEKVAAETGATVVPSFDDPYVIAGQGTAGLEIIEQLGRQPPIIVTPVGGGGLAAGLALACPDSAIVGVEPAGWDDMRRSLESGTIVPVGPDAPPTLCDALQTPRVSPLTFHVLQERDATVQTVTEEDVRSAIRWAQQEHGLTVEPGGAVALAAVLAGHVEPVEDMVIVLSGGNVDPALFARLTA